jgi:hypothetical protein
MFRADRQPRGEDPLLLLKMAIFFAAAVVATYGMATENEWVIFAAIIMLGLGFLLRFLRPRADPTADDHDVAAADDVDDDR